MKKRSLKDRTMKEICQDHFFEVEEFDTAPEKVIAPMPYESQYFESIQRPKKESKNDFTSIFHYDTLSQEQSFHLFRRMNYYKKLYKENPTEENFQAIVKDRNILTLANMRLIVGALKKCNKMGEDIISHLSLVIMYCVDGFDYRKGFKFSTYVTWGLINGIVRFPPMNRMVYVKFPDEFPESREEVRKNTRFEYLKEIMNKTINFQEKDIIERYYGIGRKKETLESIGTKYKLSKERIRQIRDIGIEKIKKVLF